MKKGRVLVTGAAGFTGRYVIQTLESDGTYDVYSDRTAEGTRVDLTCEEQVNSLVASICPNYVIHLAAISYVGHGKEEDFYKVNVDGTANLLNAVKKYSKEIKQLLVASSANTYGNVESENAISEDCIQLPVNEYARSKLEMERVIRERFSDIPIVITRPFNYTGYGQSEKFLIPKIVNSFKQRDDLISLGNIEVYRDYSDVRDVARIYKALLDMNIGSDCINICSGRSYSIREIFDICERLTGHIVEVRSLSSLRRGNEIQYLLGDNSRLHKYMKGYYAIPLIETLKWMLEGK